MPQGGVFLLYMVFFREVNETMKKRTFFLFFLLILVGVGCFIHVRNKNIGCVGDGNIKRNIFGMLYCTEGLSNIPKDYLPINP